MTLSGPVLDDEVDDMCTAIRKIRGVAEISNRMEPHESSTMFPRFKVIRGQTRPALCADAISLVAFRPIGGLSDGHGGATVWPQRTTGAATLAATGLGLLVRSATNEEFANLLHLKEQGEWA